MSIQTLAPRLRFARSSEFHQDLKSRVDAFFADTGRTPRDVPRMFAKTAVIFAWFGITWALLVFWAASWWTALPLAIVLGLAVATIGMSVQHDANHSATSHRAWVNRLFGGSLDAMGASSYVWRVKHGQIHHTYTNVAGADDDLDIGALGRLAPEQVRRPVHRFQHLYLWLLYGFLLPKWVYFDDFKSLLRHRVGQHPLPSPSKGEMTGLLAGKLFFTLWALVIPALFHPVGAMLLGFLAMCMTVGVVLSVTFQLAHCVEEAEFPVAPTDGASLPLGFAEHQLATTVDFAPDSRVLTWLMGGLNFQVVHHLFPKVCHLHYPALAQIVAQTAQDHGLQYRVHVSLANALRSHYRWLRRLGRPGAMPGLIGQPSLVAGA